MRTFRILQAFLLLLCCLSTDAMAQKPPCDRLDNNACTLRPDCAWFNHRICRSLSEVAPPVIRTVPRPGTCSALDRPACKLRADCAWFDDCRTIADGAPPSPAPSFQQPRFDFLRFVQNSIIPLTLIAFTIAVLGWQRTRSPTVLIPIVIVVGLVYLNVHMIISLPLILLTLGLYVMYVWFPSAFNKVLANTTSIKPRANTPDYRNLAAAYNFWVPFAGRSVWISLLLLGLPTAFLLVPDIRGDRETPLMVSILYGIAGLWIFFRARFSHGQARLISATPLPPAPPPVMAGGTMRATLQRRDAVYSDGPKAEMLLWLQVTDTARALLKKSSLQNVKIFREEIEPRYLYLYKDAPFVEDKKYIPRMLQEVLDRQPYLIQCAHALEIDDIERQIETSLKQLRDVLTNLDARTPATARTIEI